VIGRLGALVALWGALGCGTEAPVPDKPTWVDDVKPILQANCFHCHGSAADDVRQALPKLLVYRWDVYDLSDPRYAMLGFGEVVDPVAKVKTFVSAKDDRHYQNIAIWTAPDATDDARMPPAPALRLSARDRAVLDRWSTSGFTLGTRSNQKPEISWIEPGKRVAVTDRDGDQVLGKLDCGGTAVPIDSSGGHTLPAGANAPCSGMLFDGFDLVPVELK
jgi:hypothetical protein